MALNLSAFKTKPKTSGLNLSAFSRPRYLAGNIFKEPTQYLAGNIFQEPKKESTFQRLKGGGSLFGDVKEKPLSKVSPDKFIGDPKSKTSLVYNTILGLPDAAVEQIPFLKPLLQSATGDPSLKGAKETIKRNTNYVYDFTKGLVTMVTRAGLSGASLLKDEPIEDQVKKIPFLGNVPTYERTAYEELMVGVSPLEVGIGLAAEAAITASIIGVPALKIVKAAKPYVATKKINVTLTKQDVADIMANKPVARGNIPAFQKAVSEGVEIGKLMKENKPIIVQYETSTLIGEILYRPIGKGLFEKVTPPPTPKPIPGQKGLPGYVPITARPKFGIRGLEIEPVKEVGKATPITQKGVSKAISSELQPLAQEARKFKSADEFVKAQPKVFHGTTRDFDVFDIGKLGEATGSKSGRHGFWFTDDISTAKSYSKAENEKIVGNLLEQGKRKEALVLEDKIFANKDSRFLKEVSLDLKNPKIINAKGKTYNDLNEVLTGDDTIQSIITKAKAEGRDGLIINNLSDHADFSVYKPATHYLVFDAKNIKTKSQLTDIYNQAVKGVEPTPVAEVKPEVKKPYLIRQKETTLLKTRIRNYARGVREGSISTKEQIENTQGELVKIIKESGLDLKDQGKFISTIKNIQTPLQLAKALPTIQSRIVENIESEIKRDVQTLIDKELKYTKPVKVGDKRIGKYDYESNKFFDGIREGNRLTQESAQIKLNELPTENLSEVDLINSRFLSLKANGMKASLELYDKVISDIQRMKSLGETAKDDIDFEKKLNRQQKVDKVSGKIAERKGDKKSVITKAENLYREGFTNVYAMISSISGRDIAAKYDPQLSENRKDTAIFFQSKKMAETGVKIFETKNRKEFEKILQDMSNKEFKLVDRDGLETEIGKIEIIDIYNSVKNSLVEERYYNAFGKDQVKSLLTNLSAKDMELADNMMELVQGYKEILNKRSIETTGRDMGEIENYWPSTSEFEPNVFDDIRLQGETPSAMKARAKSSLVFPVPKNAWLKMLKHITQGEHVSHLSKRYEELKRIFTNRQIKNQISNKFGENIYNSLMQHIDYISLNRTTEKLDIIASAYDKMLNNWVKAKIASPTVFARQLGSVLNYMEDMPAGEFGKYFAEGLKNPKKTFDFMWKNAPFLEARFNRGYSEALNDALKGSNSLSVNMGSFTKATTAMVRTGDITAIIYGGYSTVMSELAKHGNMQKAIDVFETRTLHSQQAGISSSRSHFQNSSNPFAKTLLRFKNALNQYARKQGDAIISFRNKDISATQFAKTTFIYSIYAPFIYILLGWGVTQGFKAIGRAITGNEDDDEPLWSDIIEQIAINPFQAIPIIDDLSDYMYRKLAGKRTYGVFQTPMLDELATAIQKMGKKEVSFMDWIYAIGALQEPGTGIPTQVFLRYYKYILPEEKKSTPREGGSSMKDILKTYGLPELPSATMGLPELPKLPSLPGLPSIR